MHRYLVFDETTRFLLGLLEVPLLDAGEQIENLSWLKVEVDEIPILTEGTTLQLNSDNTWSVIALPVTEKTPSQNKEPIVTDAP